MCQAWFCRTVIEYFIRKMRLYAQWISKYKLEYYGTNIRNKKFWALNWISDLVVFWNPLSVTSRDFLTCTLPYRCIQAAIFSHSCDFLDWIHTLSLLQHFNIKFCLNFWLTVKSSLFHAAQPVNQKCNSQIAIQLINIKTEEYK